MACDAIRPQLRPFLDDLLDENDYHDIHSHLEICPACRSYASSVGTLSYRVYELGQAPLPPDMVSAILYESRKPSAEISEPAAEEAPGAEGYFISKTQLFWVVALVLLTLSLASMAVIVSQRKAEDAIQPALTAPAVPVELPDAAQE